MTPEQITALAAERDELQKQIAALQQDRCERLIIAFGKRMTAQTEVLQDIALSLQQLVLAGQPAAPNYKRDISAFPTFDWGSIGAEVVREDQDGVAEVSYNGRFFTRRSAANKFEPAIWFSAAMGGKDADGNPKYVRLITFKAPAEAEALPTKTTKAVAQATNRA